MNGDLMNYLLLLVFICFLCIHFYFIRKIYTLIIKRYISDITVKYINQYYMEIENEKKYVLARDIILEVLNYYHVKILETELDLLIESKVYDLNLKKLWYNEDVADLV